MIGKTLGHYEILALLGKGGMGEVYRARDTKLDREVALKVITGLTGQNAERIARFQQEARTIAALNHPNIVTLFAVEEEDGIPFLTMELIDGVPLSARIGDDGLDLDELLRIAVPIADAVSTAHRQGITHRDLKPENVMIDASGRVKVLDFGLAKLLESEGDPEDSRTVAVHRTAEGRILGTAAYMSPEQAEGKPIDARSDVFSLGIVLYEMATGRRPFQGETMISTISSIVKEQPPSALELNRGLPRHLGRILDRCLAKDPDRRYQSAIELRNELELLDRESKSGELELWIPSDTTGRARPVRRGVPVPAFVAAVVAVATGVYFVAHALIGGSSGTGDAIEVSFVAPLTTAGNVARYPSLSPSGDLFVYEAEGPRHRDIFLQRIDGRRPINLTGEHEGDDRRPAVSPDGQRIVFESTRDGGGIFVMGTTGESVRRVVASGYDPAWSPDGRSIVYTTSLWRDPFARDTDGVLQIVDVEGGTPRQITDDAFDAVQPDWSPNGRRIVYWGTEVSTGRRDLWSIGADGSGMVRLTDDDALDFSPRFGPESRFVWFVSNRTGTYNLWRMPVDPETGERLGNPLPVTMPNDAIARFDIKADRVAFAAPNSSSQVARIDLPARPGEPGLVRELTRTALQVRRPRLSPDGSQIAFYTTIGTGDQDIYIVDADGSNLRRLTEDPARDRGIDWYPDGERLIFYSDRGGPYEIWRMRTDGSDLEQISDLASVGLDTQWFPGVSPAGRYVTTVRDQGSTLWDLDPASGMMAAPRPLIAPTGLPFYTVASWHPSRPVVVGWSGNGIDSPVSSVWTYDVEADAWTELVQRIDRGWLSLAFSSDGATVFARRDDQAIVALDLGRTPVPDLYDPRVRVIVERSNGEGIHAAPDGRWLLTTAVETSSEIWGARLAPVD